ncbi:tyrosine-type recombinase/integrase [Gemmatimonadota bacterium]
MSWHTVEDCIRYWKATDGSRTYYVEVRYNGKRVKKRAGSSLTAARKLRTKLRNDLQEAELHPELLRPGRLRLSEFIKKYTADYLEVKAAKSIRQEKNRLKSIEALIKGDPYIDAITQEEIERLLIGLLKAGRTAATHNRYRSRLNSLFNKAVQWKYRDDNPVKYIERYKENSLGDRYLEFHEFQKLLKACDPDLRALVHIAAVTGIRQGALLKIRWEDIEPDLAFASLRRETTKTEEPRRVRLNSEARGVLESIGQKKSGRVFAFDRFPRKRWDEVRDGLGWGSECKVPRLRSYRFHDLRHCCGSWLVQSGVPLYGVGEILGHKELATTQRYAHLADANLADYMERIRPTTRPNGDATDESEEVTTVANHYQH